MDYPSHRELFPSSISVPKEKLSYAQVVEGSVILSSDGATNTNKGGYIAIKINQQLYEQQLAVCQHALIARIVLSKGESPWKLADLK